MVSRKLRRKSMAAYLRRTIKTIIMVHPGFFVSTIKFDRNPFIPRKIKKIFRKGELIP